jgi:hypothetical protein
MAKMAPTLHGIAPVSSAAERDALYPAPELNRRVYRTDTKVQERYNGVAWVVDPIDYANIANAPSVDAAWGSNVLTTAGLTYGYNAGSAVVAGVPTLIAEGTVVLDDNATNYIERTYDGVVSANMVGFTAGSIPMAVAVTLGGVIDTTTDYRSPASPVAPYPLKTGEAGVVSTLYPEGHVLRYGATLDGSTADDTAFAAAVVQATAIKGRVTVPLGTGALKLAANQSVPATVTLTFEDGGQISIASGKSLTIAGPIEAPHRQLFTGLGAVVFSALPQGNVHPAWWGARTDGTNDDATAWNAAGLAISPVGGEVTIPLGTTALASTVNFYTGVEHVGAGKQCIVRVKSGLGGNIIMFAPS